jgi:hypothetical protein
MSIKKIQWNRLIFFFLQHLLYSEYYYIGNQTRDLLICSAVPQPNAPPRAPLYNRTIRNHLYILTTSHTLWKNTGVTEAYLHSFLNFNPYTCRWMLRFCLSFKLVQGYFGYRVMFCTLFLLLIQKWLLSILLLGFGNFLALHLFSFVYLYNFAAPKRGRRQVRKVSSDHKM